MSDESSPTPEAVAHDASDAALNPWPGLASYTEDQRHLFFGRTAEISEMVRLVQRETLTVLFGRSGLGKSSLLRAGVMPRLRESGFFPVTLRLDFSERGEPAPVEQVKALTLAAARQAGIEAESIPENAASLTLWEWFHAVEFWGVRNDPVTPILALDQFEEVFTLGRNLPRTDDFVEQLADLIENRVPQALKDRLGKQDGRLAYDAARQDYKVILSLREDFVPKLDSLRPVLPAIMRNRFALAPLGAECACSVVLGAGRMWISEEDAKEIVAAVVGGSRGTDGDAPLVYRPDEEVEPAYLSVMCHELFRRMLALGRDAITRDLIVAERGGILEGLYTRSFAGIDDRVRFFVEDRLLTPSGFRGTLPLADATQEGIAGEDLHALVDRRLLRFEDRLGTIHMELSHDLLTGIVLKRRESRRAEAALKVETERARKLRAAQHAQRRRSRIVSGVAVALAAILIGTLWGGYYCFLQQHEAYYRTVNKRRGFPVGIGELSAAQASRLTLHYVLVYQGITWNEGRPHWKPPLRMMAMDQRGRLTTNHAVGTYFWRQQDPSQAGDLNRDRGVSLGLSAVCQWEYVSDSRGEIAYERGLDRTGRMVFGCVYSPAASDQTTARIAHYVGPDGFPQLQHKSAAEYVEIHYDIEGWESRILYLDAMARSAPGPDGAFGTTYEYDNRGNTISALSLNEQGQPMLDHAGNAGLRFSYNGDGLIAEVVSIGTDRKVLATTDGWAHIKDSYDPAGRLLTFRSYDENDQPVVRKNRLCAVTNSYDNDGDLVLESFLGPNGRPLPVMGEVVAVKHEYDEVGNEVRTTFLDPMGKPSPGRDGSSGYYSAYDLHRDLVERTVFGADGKPFLLAEGYAGWKSEFDDTGRETRRTYHGIAGEPAFATDGYHGWETQYDLRGNPVKYTYLGGDGKPAFGEGQVAGWDANFDPRGRETSRSFLGPGGEPVQHEDGYHGYTTSYDERGFEAETIYLDLGGKPVLLATGYAAVKLEHDAQGHETKRMFYDAAGKPVQGKEGYYGTFSKYDARGDLTEITTVGANGKPVHPFEHGYATLRKLYDPRGNVAEISYFDASGKPAQNDDGVVVVRNRHDVSGGLIEERYVDAEGKPAVSKEGVHYWTIQMDLFGNRTHVATFGLHDEPVPGVAKTCAKTNRYDERNNEIESRWYGPEGKLTPGSGGYALERRQYDEQNNFVGMAYFGTDEKPSLSSDKTHRWTKKYDGRRNVVRWDFFGVHDEPVIGTGGYASSESEYDPRGKETRRTYLGTDGKPVDLPAYHYAVRTHSYLPDGQLSRTDYYGARGEKALCDEGYCSYSADYDNNGQMLFRNWVGLPGLTAYATLKDAFVDGWKRSQRSLSVDDRLVNNAAGYAQVNLERDDTGYLLRYTYADADGKPAFGERGFVSARNVFKVWKYYDAADHEMPDIEHDGVRPLLYVSFLNSADTTAAKTGLLPGDIIWRMSSFSYSDMSAKVWESDRDYETAREKILAAWNAALASSGPTPMSIGVIRRGVWVELSIPALPAAGLGATLDLRRIPTGDYDRLVQQFEKGSPPPSSKTGTARPTL